VLQTPKTVQVGSHSQQLTNRDNTGTANACKRQCHKHSWSIKLEEVLEVAKRAILKHQIFALLIFSPVGRLQP
jgi:hypothetical protein